MKNIVTTSHARHLLIVIALAAMTGCADTPKNPNPRADTPLTYAKVDLPKYMGQWYIVARIPYFLEKGMVGEKTHFTLRDDGRIDEAFSTHKGTFESDEKTYHLVDTPDPSTGNAYWSVRLFWPIYGSQATIYVDDAYEYTLIGYQDKSLGWIFARKPELSEAKYRELLKRFDDQGYDSSKFRRVPQKPDEIGKPGFDDVVK